MSPGHITELFIGPPGHIADLIIGPPGHIIGEFFTGEFIVGPSGHIADPIVGPSGHISQYQALLAGLQLGSYGKVQ